MRSFTRCQDSDMDRVFWCSLLLSCLPVIESVEKGCLSQPNKVIWKKTGRSADLHCTVRSHCLPNNFHYEWFVFKENVHFCLNLNNPAKYSLNEASLHITSLQVNDSGIYHCAAALNGSSASGAQHVGMGTTLVVREQDRTWLKDIVLWLSFVLLAIYTLVIVTLILKKYGYKMSGRTDSTDKRISTKKVQFRDVLQEMNSKGKLGRGKKTASRHRPEAEASSTEFNNSADDIYQNV
ncbi:immunoglobulin superfamily member 6 [Epinephelus moara]|uniref:immunoglobulin superfamily member 6 n=1 Tax=Epinephelus moara TaxID=300413 RepID=UPI00214E8634|nr:immunoglobulin superfamily member 6 [Epinephelus moara]